LADSAAFDKGFRRQIAPMLRIPLPAAGPSRHHRSPEETVDTRTPERGPLLDEANKAIIEQLQQDGRRPYATVAKAVGLSEAAVRQRVQRLLDAGVMQIVAVTDALQLGFARQALVGVRADGDVRDVADKLAALPEVDYVVITAGSFDLILEVVCADDERLLALLNDSIRAVPGVRDTETLVYLRLVKQTYSWGTR
jgi:Lrp/AsnC family transcriptional regulator for asnA, asnC and gidA